MFSASTTYEKQLRIEKTRLSHQVWSHGGSTFKKNMTLNGHFSRPAETDPYVSNGPLSHVLGIMRVLCSNCLIFLHLVVLLNYTNNNIDIDSIIGRCFKQSSPSIQQTINYSSKKCWVFGVVLEGCSFSLFFHCKYNVSKKKISIYH